MRKSSFPLITTSGRLTKPKAFEDVIYVFEKVKYAEPYAKLIIIGDGEEFNNLKRLVANLNLEDSVIFRGKVQRVEVLDDMARSKIFLFMSAYKGDRLPNVVKEAMASKCACVVSDTTGIEELVEDGKTGFIVKKHDIEAASARVLELIKDDKKREQISIDSMNFVKENFSIKNSIGKYTTVWKEELTKLNL